MGFFSSKKAEPTPLPASQRASAKVIRSRFYSKSKSAGQAPPAPSESISPSALSTTLPSFPARIPEALPSNQSLSSQGGQVSADALTMSLAQGLNDLAVANADDLLNDDEYRLLRQNLFERYTVGSDPPTAPHVVPKYNGTTNRPPVQHINRTPSVSSRRSISTAVSSLFRRATGRVAVSPTASASGSIFSAQQQMSPTADSASIMSSPARRPSVSFKVPYATGLSKGLTRRPSDESLISSSQASVSLTNDMRGILSRHNIIGNDSTNYASSISSRVTTRSSKPPSSFHLRHPGLRQTYSRTHEDDDGEDRHKSSAELREEIESLEAEGRKLLDAFNGLELSALTKSRSSASSRPLNAPPDLGQRRRSIYPESASPSALGSAYTLIPDKSGPLRVNPAHNHVPPVMQPIHLKRKPSVVNSIAGSLKSSASDLRSTFLAATPPSLHNTRSSPNLNASRLTASTSALPVSNSVPGAPLKMRPLIRRQKSSISNGIPPLTASVTRSSPLTHRTNAAADPALHELEVELADIRRRKADVSVRYERRLEFLRAKLKAAEIRERLTKK